MSRKSHLGNPDKWLGSAAGSDHLNQVADYITEVNSGRRILCVLRIPSAERYLEFLDDGVRDVVFGEGNAVETLASVALSWGRLTDELGADNQKLGYRRSEGLSD